MKGKETLNAEHIYVKEHPIAMDLPKMKIIFVTERTANEEQYPMERSGLQERNIGEGISIRITSKSRSSE